MKSNKRKVSQHPFVTVLCMVVAVVGLTRCGDDATTQANPKNGPTNGTSLPAQSGVNVIPLTVNGTTCSSGSYPNKPCISVTICNPLNPTQCQTINDILLDTGSVGLRVFKSQLTAFSLPPMTNGSGGSTVQQCIEFGDGSTDWGTVAQANIQLGSEPAVTVPIQLIDSTAVGEDPNCKNSDTGPSQAGFNGILGVGLFVEDCGTSCSIQANNGMYFGCTGSTCSGITVSKANQIQNPVAHLPVDNNGLIVQLPSVPVGGSPSASGYLILGIGTRSNNIPGNVTLFSASSSYGEFKTNFNGTVYDSFLDTGSNGLYFPAPASVPDCSTTHPSISGYACPGTTLSFSATNTASSGNPSQALSFQIGNAYNLFVGPNSTFVELGGSSGGSLGAVFDWGLPFFLGRNVYVGFEGKSAAGLGIGPYWAY